MKPCLTCGEPSDSSRCPEHGATHRTARRGSARSRGYDATWDKLSKRARALSPFCEDCGTDHNLTVDHLPEAWRRKAKGKAIRLQDVAVVCGPCNTRRGSSRPSETPQTHGRDTLETSPGPRGKASSQLQSELPSAPYAPKEV